MTTSVDAIAPIVRDLRRRPRVLVVEDDPSSAEFVRDNLTADSMDVTVVATAEAAMRAMRDERPDIALIDDGLPDLSGLDLVTRIRAGDPGGGWDSRIALVMVTGRAESNHVVRCLGRGADDYVVKPFDYQELLTRMAATLRRTRGSAFSERLVVGELVIDCTGLSASFRGEPVSLCAKEFALLVALARDPGRTISKAELLHDVWGFARPTSRTRTLDTHASRLRRKLADAGVRDLVHNVWGFGYRLLPTGV